MEDLKLKEIFAREIPDVDYGVLKSHTMERVKRYDEKRLRENLYFIPKAGVSLLYLMLTINTYAFLQEIFYNLQSRSIGITGIVALPLFTLPFLIKVLAVLGDNVLAILVATFMILLVDRHALGIYRFYRFLKHSSMSFASMLVKVPNAALSLLRVHRPS